MYGITKSLNLFLYRPSVSVLYTYQLLGIRTFVANNYDTIRGNPRKTCQYVNVYDCTRVLD